ncbi:MAG: hypothetical protein ACK6BG_08640 [Cyanobacteriota bacterium]
MAPLVAVLALFLLLCTTTAARLHLWGDEAYTLQVAARPVDAILSADPFHLPTTYLALHPIVGWFPAGTELPLRLLHALIFGVGLVFCWRIARSLLGSGRAAWGVMALTILLPNYLFYATNIRMYAPLFAASLAFLWTAFRLLEPGGNKRRGLLWHGLTALLCVLIDWPGLLLVALTWIALLALHGRQARAWARGRGWWLVAAGGLLAIGAALFREPILRLLLEWPSAARAAGLADVRLAALARMVFLQIRPLLDIVYPPTLPLALNGLLWLLLLVAAPLAAAVLWRGGDRRERLVVVLAFSWVAGSPFGLAVTRAFLPSQFFVLLSLALALRHLRSGLPRDASGRRLRPLALLLSAALIAVGLANLQQALEPTLRLYSRIPYPTIAREAVAAARARQLPLIAVSRHTLNALSVERFGRPLLRGSEELRLLSVKPDCAAFPRGRFVYVQLMPEDGEASDPEEACAGQATVAVETLRVYVPFAELGWNPLWQGNLRERGEGGAGARLRLVTISGPADAALPPG